MREQRESAVDRGSSGRKAVANVVVVRSEGRTCPRDVALALHEVWVDTCAI